MHCFDITISTKNFDLKLLSKKAAWQNVQMTAGTGGTWAAPSDGDTASITMGADGVDGKWDLSVVTFTGGDSVEVDGNTYNFAAGADGSDGLNFSDVASLKTALGKNGIKMDTTDPADVKFTKAATPAAAPPSRQAAAQYLRLVV